MLKKRNTFTVLTAIFISIILYSCGSTIPSWYSEIPKESNKLTAANTALSKDMQTAVDQAKLSAMADIGTQMETHISGLTKKFKEETGFAEDSELLMYYNQAVKSVVDQTLMGVRIDKQKVLNEKKNLYRAFVLISMPIGEANMALLDKIKASKHLYTKFQASQAFKELNEEVGKFRQFKKEHSTY